MAKHNSEETEEALLDRSMANQNTAWDDDVVDLTLVQVACLRRKALVLCALPSRAAQFSRRVFCRAGAAGS